MNFLFVKDDVWEERKSICASCPYVSESGKTCTKCKCCIGLKCRLKAASCPVGNWQKETKERE